MPRKPKETLMPGKPKKETIDTHLNRYHNLKTDIDVMTAELKRTRSFIDEYVRKNGHATGKSSSKFSGKEYTAVRTERVPKPRLERDRAYELVKSKYPGLLPELTVEILNEEAFAEAVLDGDITQEDFLDVTVAGTPSVSVTVKENERNT